MTCPLVKRRDAAWARRKYDRAGQLGERAIPEELGIDDT